MRINVKQLESGGADGEKRFDFCYELDLSIVERWGVKPFSKPARLDGCLISRSGIMTLSYKAVFAMEEPCARCLTPVKKEIGAEFVHNVIETADRDDPGDSEGFIPASGGFLDMDELAVSDILLSQEGMLLCKPDCKGLCPKCGVNLNENVCSCRLAEPDPRFAKLLELIKPEGSGE